MIHYNTYAGIGARGTPGNILTEMTTVANNLEQSGFVLRSGGAHGADSAFEAGVSDPRHAKIFLPWQHFNNNPSPLHRITNEALEMASSFHPAWHRCSPAARKFHARNCYQMLGLYLDSPVTFVLCWTPNGEITGGTGQALRIAQHHNIPIFNMANLGWDIAFNDLVAAIMNQDCDWDFEGEGDNVPEADTDEGGRDYEPS